MTGTTNETIGLIVAAGSGPVTVPDLAGLAEVLDIGAAPTSGLAATAGRAKIPYKYVSSTGAAGHRGNLGISLAGSDWIIALAGGERLADGWVGKLTPYLRQTSSCAVTVSGSTGVGRPLVAAKRQAFAYGSLDGRHRDVADAMTHWLQSIFPRHRYRTLPCEGIEKIEADWMQTPEPHVDCLPDEDTRVPSVSGTGYDARDFWEEGGRGWVKWEAFQPDESEIEDIVAHTKPRRVLELGCGAGRNARYFTSADEYTGLDISTSFLARALDRNEKNNLGFICADAAYLPFADSRFDLTFSVSTIQHVTPDRIDRCLTDVVRVSSRYICFIEFVDELEPGGGWFSQRHMFRHDYETLMRDKATLVLSRPVALQVQPAIKKLFLFEKQD